MFSDRFWIVKVALAFGAFVLLCRASKREFNELRPDVEQATYESDRIKGHRTYLWAKVVTQVHEDGFSFRSKAGEIRAVSNLSPQVGDRIHAVARFTGHPRQVELERARVMEGYAWKRGLNYGLSALCVLVYLFLIRKRFSWNPQAGLFRSRY